MSSKTKLLQKLGVEHPIFLSPMAGVSPISLSAAVTNSGGLGSIPLASIDFRQDDGLRKLNALIEDYAAAIDKPRNVVNLNFFCHEVEHAPDTAQVDNWTKLYQKAIHASGDVLAKAQFTNGNVSFRELERDHPAKYSLLMEYLETMLPTVVSFHFGIPPNGSIRRLQKGGTLVFVSATSLAEARAVIEKGADGVVLQSYEAGGHRGNFLADETFDENLSTHALFSQVKKYVDTLPSDRAPYLIPAGGIVDADTIRYYLAHGADAVQLGTAFLATPESLTAKFFSAAVGDDPRAGTIMVDLVSGKRARAVRTPFIDALVGLNEFRRDELPAYGYAYNAYKSLKPLVEQDIGFYLAGQNYHQISKGKLAEQVMHELVNGLK
ncbi:putative nitronate monooxygenase [Candida viswanathii]|jgi:nitronate monooxygenase|uniref:Putative nitronate monooxygenase n=1 Tax=Candida viswanathii TaxID=5486 RepID=A0A367YKL1_9ASCO|nr:putative nitronate monooxygenase [Candida viswanathii]RCK66439.1 putative nitronate monooxygenase [Candida viswanathii]